MHKIDEMTGDEARDKARQPRPFGVGLTNPAIERLEIWGRLFDADGKPLGTHRIDGY